jgi:serine/threonine-protein kinase
MEAMLGQVLVDRYELTEIIGEGGMGTVYRAHQLGVGRDVAIKILNPGVAHDEAEVTRLFFREARAVCQLSHPNTITLFDFGRTADGLLYITMELIRGEPLSAMIHRGPLQLLTAIHIVEQITGVLHEAHSAGIVHRDIKPDNILVESKIWDPHFAKVLDFGIAKIVGSDLEAASTALRFGTPLYMSPEQIVGEPSDDRTDLYMLGAVFHECLTGSPPFVARTAVDICIKHLDSEVPPLHSWDSPVRYPDSVEDLVQRMLAKKREDRPESAAAVLHTLAEITAAELAGARTSITAMASDIDSSPRSEPATSHPPPEEMRTAQSIELTDAMRARIHARRHAKDDQPTAPEPIAARASVDARDPQDLMTQITVLRMEELAGKRPMASVPDAGSRPGSARAADDPLPKPKPRAPEAPPKRSSLSALPTWFLPTILGLTFALVMLIVAALNEG